MTDIAAEPEAAETATSPKAPSIHVLMARVLADLPAVGKTSHNDDDGYSFRGIDDALNALNPILAANGVFYLPTVLKRRYEQRGTGRGAVYYVVHLKVRFRFYGPNGDHVDAVVWGEGMDLADKSTSKAHTAAQKVAVVQAFSISTRETAQNDADKTTPEETHGRPQAHADPPPADPLWKTIGWESREELDEVYQPLLELCRHLSPEVQADLKAWRTERSITLPPQKALFPQLYAKVLDLTSPPAAPAKAPAPAATPPIAPATDVVEEKPPAAEATAEPTPAPEAKAEPKPAPAQPASAAAGPPPAVDADPLTKAQKDLAELQERAQAAASGKAQAEPTVPAPSSAPSTPGKAKAAKAAPKPQAAAAETAPAKPQSAAAAPEATKTDGDDEADPMACTARYDGCAGQIESPQQKDMSQFRWQKPMCKSCTKKTAQAAKHGGDPAPASDEAAQ